MAVVKHVPTRAVLWAFIGLAVGVVCVGVSFAIAVLVMDRGAFILGYLVAVPVAIPLLGGALFGMHGLHRGAARAALDLEKRFGLVRFIVGGVMGLLIKTLGGPVSNLPLEQIETKLKAVIAQYLRPREGTDLAAWVVTRAKRIITRHVETCLLATYRAETQADGSGGGVSLERVAAKVSADISGRLGGLVMSPLNQQLAIFMTLYVVVASGWWYWLFLLARLIRM